MSLTIEAHADQPRTHDGLYLRLGLGPGFSLGSSTASGKTSRVLGGHVGTEIAVGGTLRPGLVMGGGSYSMIVPGPTYTYDGTTSASGAHHVSGVGPFVDYYFLGPDRGAHLQGALLLSGAYRTKHAKGESAFGGGFGAMFGGGWEHWVSDKWSLGGILRVAYYRDALTGSSSDKSVSLSLFSPTLLVAGTFH